MVILFATTLRLIGVENKLQNNGTCMYLDIIATKLRLLMAKLWQNLNPN